MSDNLNIIKKFEKNNEICDKLQQERRKLYKYKILYQALKEYPLNTSLSKKVKDMDIKNSIQQVIRLEQYNLLGITSNTSQLGYTESLELKGAITDHLEKVEESIKLDIENIMGRRCTNILEKPSLKTILELKNKLEDAQTQYIASIENYAEILEESLKKRLQEVPEIGRKKLQETELQTSLNQLKYKLAQSKIRTDIFKETSYTLNAYKKLIEDLENQIYQCRQEVEALKELKKKYELVQCKQFEDMVKEFAEYKIAIEKKTFFLNTLRS